MDIQQRIQEIDRLLEQLPQGRLTYKKIKGREQPYLQWHENGRTLSRYVKTAEREQVLRLLAERDALLEERRQLRTSFVSELDLLQQLQQYRSTALYVAEESYHTNVICGERLRRMTDAVDGYGTRDCFERLEHFLRVPVRGRVCLLYGLRRTGKTTMLLQAIRDFDAQQFARTAYIKVNQKTTMGELNRDLRALQTLGYEYIFIDEATLMQDFIDSAALISDVYAAMGMHIVLSGTDSLGFWLTLRDELYDRALAIHTTYIPFREFSRLLGIHEIDEYIRYGGTLRAGETDFEDEDLVAEDAPFRDDEATRRYIDTAICRNIQNSLNCCRDGRYFRHLQALYDAGELTGAINRIIESMNHQFLLKVLTQEFKSHDLGSAAEILRKQADPEKRTDLLDRIDREAVTAQLMQLLEIRNAEDRRIGITATHAVEIKEYLKALDLVMDCPRETVEVEAEPMEYVLFTQPGMRFSQAQALVYALTKDTIFSAAGERVRKLARERILEDVSGRMLEDIVLLETARTLPPHKRAFKLTLSRSEFDMVIYDENTDTCELYEIKHSRQQIGQQYHVLADAEACHLVEQKYGHIGKRCVLYRGEDLQLENGIEYRNVEDYLMRIG